MENISLEKSDGSISLINYGKEIYLKINIKN